MIGTIAATLTTISFIPQAWSVLKTKDVRSISLPMYILFTIGVLCWTIYGIQIHNTQIMVANGITLVLAACILYCKIRYGSLEKNRELKSEDINQKH